MPMCLLPILQTPSGQEIIVQPDKNGRQDVLTNRTEVLVYAGQPSPYSVWQEIFLTCSHGERLWLSPESGRFHLIRKKIVLGSYQLLPTQQSRSADDAVCTARSAFDDDDSFDGAKGDFGRSNPLIL